MLNLEGKKAVITGATKGIGFAIAQELAREGATILVNHRPEKPLPSETLESLEGLLSPTNPRLLVCEGDMTIEEDVVRLAARAVQEMGRIDIWVNNVGSHLVTPGLEQSKASWDGLFAANATSAFLGCREAARAMKEIGGGSIINIASKMALVGSAENACYCAAKAAVVMMTRCFGAEWAPYQIRVNAVAPGITWTEPTHKVVENKRDLEAALHYRVPMQRFGRPEEIAKAVVFLASDAASYVTGTTLVCDGGWIANSDFAGIPPAKIDQWEKEF